VVVVAGGGSADEEAGPFRSPLAADEVGYLTLPLRPAGKNPPLPEPPA
jgi:hypothetical protein